MGGILINELICSVFCLINMSTAFDKIFEAVTQPDKVEPYLRKVARTYRDAMKVRDVDQLLDTTGGILLGERYLRWKHDDSVIKTIQGSEMRLDTSSTLGQELITYGIREPITTQAYQKELRSLKRSCNRKITVLDIGSNIGYYALIAADVLGEQAQIHAIEPDPNNYDRLVENIERNRVQSRIQTHNLAIGLKDGCDTLLRHPEGNLHRLSQYSFVAAMDQIETKVRHPETFLREQDISLDSVNTIRMDLEGLECDLLLEMEDILKSSTPLVLQVELHTRSEHFDSVIKILKNNFKIISMAKNNKSYSHLSFDEMTWGPYTELVLRSHQ